MKRTAWATALLLPALTLAASPTRLLDHELAELHRWGKRLKAEASHLAPIEASLREHEPERRRLLLAALEPAKAMDRAWGLLWNDQPTLDASLPVLGERLRALLAHERARLVAASATLPDGDFAAASAGLEARARGAPKLPRKHADQQALAGALETTWAAYQLAEPTLAAPLEAGVRRAWERLQPLRARWREVTDRVRAGLEESSEWERHRWRDELEALARDGEAVLVQTWGELADELGPAGQQGLAVSVLRNLRRIGAVVEQYHQVEELELAR